MELKFLNNYVERITIETTNVCNFQCRTCFLGGMKRKKSIPPRRADGYFSSGLFNKLIGELQQYENYKNIGVNLSGGEPFLNQDIFDILGLARLHKIRLTIFTNGSCLDDRHILKITRNHSYALMFSIDGLEVEHDANRGVGSFAKIIKTIQNLQRTKEKLSLQFPKLTINTLINKLNVNSFEKVVLLAQELGCDLLSFSLVQWSNESIIRKSTEEFYQRFGVYQDRAKIIENINHRLGALNSKEIAGVIERIKMIKISLPKNTKLIVSFFPDFPSSNEITKWFSGVCYKIDYCSSIFSQLRIDYNGDVYPGCSIPFYILGNIQKETLWQILNGQKAKRLYKEIKTNGYFYVCQRCCRRPANSKTLDM